MNENIQTISYLEAPNKISSDPEFDHIISIL
jgi:hypothetical protein